MSAPGKLERLTALELRRDGCGQARYLSQGTAMLDAQERLRESFDPLAEAFWLAGANAAPVSRLGRHCYPRRPAEQNADRAYDVLRMDAFYGPNRGGVR